MYKISLRIDVLGVSIFFICKYSAVVSICLVVSICRHGNLLNSRTLNSRTLNSRTLNSRTLLHQNLAMSLKLL